MSVYRRSEDVPPSLRIRGNIKKSSIGGAKLLSRHFGVEWAEWAEWAARLPWQQPTQIFFFALLMNVHEGQYCEFRQTRCRSFHNIRVLCSTMLQGCVEYCRSFGRSLKIGRAFAMLVILLDVQWYKIFNDVEF